MVLRCPLVVTMARLDVVVTTRPDLVMVLTIIQTDSQTKQTVVTTQMLLRILMNIIRGPTNSLMIKTQV